MRSAAALPFCLALGGCSTVQSALSPAGEQAAQIAVLTWILLGVLGGVLLIVLGALWLAIRGSDNARRLLSADWAVSIGGIAFPAVVLTALLAGGLWLMRPATTDAALTIEVEGRQWWWRVGYVLDDGTRIEAANEIRIPVGQEVDFVLTSSDVIHSFWVPSLGGKLDMIPGRTNRLRLKAERPGIYRGQCAEYCGGPHALMAFEVVALPEADFAAWRQAAGQPVSTVRESGFDVFAAAGCGSCHAIAGTSANGRVGPDLSRVGERRMMAAATMPTSEENIARFIADGQRHKPGNLMPEFDVLTDEQTKTIASYLARLK